MKIPALVLAVVLTPCCFAQTNTKSSRVAGQPSRAAKPETPHLEFVTEYIRELAAVERIRAADEK